jgi:hypothetical protein
MQECCGTCLFWLEIESDDTNKTGLRIGSCRRYPPTITATPEQQKDELRFYGPVDGVRGGVFPLTETDTWCGEYEAKK